MGTLHAEVVGEQGEYPGISVELEKADGSRGFVSLTEVCDGDLTYDGRTRLQTNCYDGVHEEPTAVECDPDGPFMSESAPELIGEKARDDRAWHESLVILETRGEDALLFNPSNAHSPFIVAAGFDHQSRSWSYGKYFSDVMSASCYHNEAVHPKYAVPGLTPSALEKISGLGLEANDDLDRVCRGVNALLAIASQTTSRRWPITATSGPMSTWPGRARARWGFPTSRNSPRARWRRLRPVKAPPVMVISIPSIIAAPSSLTPFTRLKAKARSYDRAFCRASGPTHLHKCGLTQMCKTIGKLPKALQSRWTL